MAKKTDLTLAETKCALSILDEVLRGGDPRVMVRGKVGRSLMMKLIAKRDAATAPRPRSS